MNIKIIFVKLGKIFLVVKTVLKNNIRNYCNTLHTEIALNILQYCNIYFVAYL